MNDRSEPVLSELCQSIEIGKLRFWRRCGFLEPISKIRLAMHAKRRADRVAILAFFKTILTRENLDAVFEAAAFDWNAKPQGKIVNVDAALSGQQRRFAEYPEMTAAA